MCQGSRRIFHIFGRKNCLLPCLTGQFFRLCTSLIVGTHTTGKGRAQRTYQLSDGSAVNLSVEEYFTPKGKSLADVGIAPDIEVKLTDEQTQNFFFLTPETDPQLQKAMETVG